MLVVRQHLWKPDHDQFLDECKSEMETKVLKEFQKKVAWWASGRQWNLVQWILVMGVHAYFQLNIISTVDKGLTLKTCTVSGSINERPFVVLDMNWSSLLLGTECAFRTVASAFVNPGMCDEMLLCHATSSLTCNCSIGCVPSCGIKFSSITLLFLFFNQQAVNREW